MNKIIKGDEVIVISGKDKGKRGTVLERVDATHLLVDGINVVKKHQKPNPMKGQTGGVVEKVMPIDVSNVALYDAKSGKAGRVAIRSQDGKNVRVFRSSGDAVPAATTR